MRRPAVIGAAWLLASILTVCGIAVGWDAPSPVQHGTLANTETASTASTAVTNTITGVAFKQVHIYKIGGRSSSIWFASFTVTNAGTTVWSTDASFVTTNYKEVNFVPAITGSVGSTMAVTLG